MTLPSWSLVTRILLERQRRKLFSLHPLAFSLHPLAFSLSSTPLPLLGQTHPSPVDRDIVLGLPALPDAALGLYQDCV